MKTREELDAEWKRLDESVYETDDLLYPPGVKMFTVWLGELIAAERAFVDRHVAAKAIRWVATCWRDKYPLNRHAREWSAELDKVAAALDRSEIALPEPPT